MPKYDTTALADITAFNILEKGQSLVKALFIHSFVHSFSISKEAWAFLETGKGQLSKRHTRFK